VLTSYIVAAAIMTPVTGWLAGRIGRKKLFLISVVGFVIASVLCGLATEPCTELVGFRLLQGVFGAALIPLSQAVVLDINPPEQARPGHGDLGRASMVGPDPRPGLGGWLTDQLFLALGVLHQPADRRPGAASASPVLHVGGPAGAPVRKFDFLGFGMLTLFVGGFQMVLDRGPAARTGSSRRRSGPRPSWRAGRAVGVRRPHDHGGASVLRAQRCCATATSCSGRFSASSSACCCSRRWPCCRR
jgi:DHA2 family multidrug resistance protein